MIGMGCMPGIYMHGTAKPLDSPIIHLRQRHITPVPRLPDFTLKCTTHQRRADQPSNRARGSDHREQAHR